MNRINRNILKTCQKISRRTCQAFKSEYKKKTRQYKNAQAFKINKTRISKTFSGKKKLKDKLNLIQKEKDNKKITNKRQFKEELESEEEEEDKPAEVESKSEEIVEEKVKKPEAIIVKKS